MFCPRMLWSAPILCVLVSRVHADLVVDWVSSPVLPNETAMLQSPSGAGFAMSTNLSLCNAVPESDGAGTGAGEDVDCEPLDLIQPWDRGAKFVVPAARQLGVWNVLEAVVLVVRNPDRRCSRRRRHASSSSAP